MAAAIAAITMKPRSVGFISVQIRLMSPSRRQRPHGERARDQRSPREPEEAAARLGRSVEPWRQNGYESKRAVGVVQALRSASVVREQQQPEPDLRHEE